MAQSVDNVTVAPYAQINHGVMVTDSAAGTKTYTADNDNSASRAGVRVNADVADTGLSVGAHVELEYQVNPSNAVSENERTISGEFAERHLNIYVAGAFGKVSVGQGDGAANGNIERDLSGTAVISYANPGLVGGGLNFVETSSPADVVRFGAAMSDQDFESRYTRVRYDLPKFGPVSLAVSQGTKNSDEDVSELSARFDSELGGAGKLSAALGYSSRDVGGATDKADTIGGSVSWLHDSGVNLTGAYSAASDDNSANPDSDFYLVKLGYKTGMHAMDIHMMEASDRVAEGDTATTVGVGYVYSPAKYFSAYPGYNTNSLDRDAGDYENVDTLFVGGLLKF
jgi:hypothetical protein